MRITAKVDYAVRAATELAAHADEHGTRTPMKGEAVAAAQGIPVRFLESILAELRRSGIVGSQRGSDGGYWLARPAAEVSVADIIRAVEGPLADVHGTPPEETEYDGAAVELQRVWIATRVALRQVLEATTLADIATGALPEAVTTLAGATRRVGPAMKTGTTLFTFKVRPSPRPTSGPPSELRPHAPQDRHRAHQLA